MNSNPVTSVKKHVGFYQSVYKSEMIYVCVRVCVSLHVFVGMCTCAHMCVCACVRWAGECVYKSCGRSITPSLSPSGCIQMTYIHCSYSIFRNWIPIQEMFLAVSLSFSLLCLGCQPFRKPGFCNKYLGAWMETKFLFPSLCETFHNPVLHMVTDQCTRDIFKA